MEIGEALCNVGFNLAVQMAAKYTRAAEIKNATRDEKGLGLVRTFDLSFQINLD